MSTGNKRVSQLVEMTANQVEFQDLFLIIDVTARESKRIQASELSLWLNNSGSLYAVNALNADTASFVLGSNVYGIVASASYAISASHAAIASIASSSISSSNAFSSSYALTSSFTLSGGTGGTALTTGSTYEITSSWAITAANAVNAQNASFLLYFGGNNGTASYAMVSGLADTATRAATASYFDNTVGMVASASYAVNSDTASSVAGNSVGTASYLVYSPTNGTAAFAIQAGSVAGVMNNYGMFDALVQSSTGSVIPNLSVISSLGTFQNTMVQATGDVILSWTASSPENTASHYVYLYVLDRRRGYSYIQDTSTIAFNMANVINSWGNPTSGTMRVPFNLVSQGALYGEYFVEVSSSNPHLKIDTSRNTKFIFSSYSDNLSVDFADPIRFFVNPTSSVTLSFSSSATPTKVTKDYCQFPGFYSTASTLITWMDVSSQNADRVEYSWTLPNMQGLVCSGNPSLTALNYAFPYALQYLDASDCALTYVANLDTTTSSYVNIENNQLVSLPALSPSTSYLKCSNNPITDLPTYLPESLRYLYAHDTSIGGTIPVLPDGILRVQLYNNSIQALPNPLPLSMSYLDISNTLVTTMSAAPVSLSYVDVSNALFNTNGLVNLTSELVSNAQVSGTFLMLGYGTITDPQLLVNLAALTASNWTNYYDP